MTTDTSAAKKKSVKRSLTAPGRVVILRLTHSDRYGSHYLTLSFVVVDVLDEEKLIYQSDQTAQERALANMTFKGFWNDIGTGHLLAFDGVKLTDHEPEQWEVERALPVMRLLNKALTKHRNLTQDYSFAASAVALANAVKVDRLDIRFLPHSGKRDERVSPRGIHGAVRQVVEDFEVLHRGTWLGRTA